jgi:hypothetical protein
MSITQEAEFNDIRVEGDVPNSKYLIACDKNEAKFNIKILK